MTEVQNENSTFTDPSEDSIPDFKDPIVYSLRDELTSLINKANELFEFFNSVNLDFDSLLTEVQRDFTSPEIEALEAQIDQLYRGETKRRIDLVSEDYSEEDVAKAKSEYGVMKKSIENLANGFLVLRYGEESVRGLPALKGSRGRASSSSNGDGRGAGVLRIRGYDWSYNNSTYDNLSSAIKVADLDIKEVQAALLEAYGEDRNQWPNSLGVVVKGKSIYASKKADQN